MANFGDLIYESSCACADDEEEDPSSENSIGLAVEWTEEGEKYLKGAGPNSHVFCAFTGKVAVGFGEGFLKKDSFALLGKVVVVGDEGTVDLYTRRPKRKPTVRIYLGGKVVFAFVDFYGLPRILSNQVAEKLSPLLNISSEVVIFHSETSVFNRGEENLEGKLLFMYTEQFDLLDKKIPKAAVRFQHPNLISGPSAAIITHAERMSLSGLLLATYCETELVDSISMKAFFQAIKKSADVTSGFDLGNVFSPFQYSIAGTLKGNDSNLYV